MQLVLPRGFRLACTLAVSTVLPAIAFVRPLAAQPTIGLYADPAGSSCSFSGNSPGLITTYVVVRPDDFGVRAVQFAAQIPPCLGATYVSESVPAGMLAIGSSQTGINIGIQACKLSVVNVLQITYLRSGDTVPCCEFSLVPDPAQGELVAVSCGYQELPLVSVASHFNADASCACVGNSPPRRPVFPSPYEYETGVSVGTSFNWEASDADGNLAEFDVYLGTTPTPPLVAAELTAPTYTPAAPLAELTQHYWRVVARDALGLETSSATWTFTTRAVNSPPNPPQNPGPANATLGVSLAGVNLRWQASDIDGDPLTYDVYFGTTTPPPLVATDLASTSYASGVLNFDTVYYWRIVARDTEEHETSGPIWWFETRPQNNPPFPPGLVAPANDAFNVTVTPTLSWTVSDLDNGPLVSDVYFGTSPTPPLVVSGSSATTYAPGTLSFATHYYWRIVVRDQLGAEGVGATWNFTTRPENLPPLAPFGPSPANNTVISTQSPTLTWQCSDPDGDAVTYDVYFGVSPSTPLVATNHPTNSYAPGLLLSGVLYRWRIVARDARGAETVGPTWAFLVQPNLPSNVPNNPSPPNSSSDRSIFFSTLAWQCTDPNGQPLTFDVYFGTESPPPLVATDVPVKSYFPGLLAFTTTYRWRIVARDPGGTELSGPEWSFTTKANSSPSVPSNPSPPNHSAATPGAVLTWQCSDVDFQALTFDVYFGTTSPPPLAASGLTERSFAPGTLPLGQFFWRVVASDGQLSTSGPTWDFNVAPLGDANLDGVITVEDASCALGSFIQSGPCMLGGPVADVNCSGTVTPADARCIHKHVLNSSCTFCGEPAPGVQTPLVSLSATWESEGTMYARLMVSGVPSLRALGFSVSSWATSMSAVRHGVTNDFVELRNSSASPYGYPGIAIVGGYSLSGVSASTPVEFIELRFYSANWLERFVYIYNFVDDLAGAYPLSFYLGGGGLPVLITSFNAAAVDGGVEVRWELRSDEAVESFTLYRREEGAALPVEVAHGPAGGSSQSYLDTSVEGGKTYHYELLIHAAAGGEFRSQIATVSTGALVLSLGQNQPNPFNPQTIIPYDLPHSMRQERVRLWIIDISGRIVTTLVDEEQGGGSYRVTWQGRDDRGEAVSSGVYFYVLDVSGQRRTKKLVLLK